MMNRLVMAAILGVVFTLGLSHGLTYCVASPDPGEVIQLKNDTVMREFRLTDNGVYKTSRIAGASGRAEVRFDDSDEFHILLLDGTELTIDDYRLIGTPDRSEKTGVSGQVVQQLVFSYQLHDTSAFSGNAPPTLDVVYTLGSDEAYLRKQVEIPLKVGQSIDRLEVERFVTATPSSRGGRGEPVWLGDDVTGGDRWFCGLEFPAGYSRCKDGNTPEAHSGPYDLVGNYSQVFLEDRDVLDEPVDGMVRLFHFPGTAMPLSWYDIGNPAEYQALIAGQPDGVAPKDVPHGIVSKTSVFGLGRPSQDIESTFSDYLDTIRRPVRSFIHYNNWYDGDGKDIRPENFVDHVYEGFRENLEPYGVTIQAMVPDNGWQNKNSVYQPSPSIFPSGDQGVAELARQLRDGGSNLGLWIALNNYNSIGSGGPMPEYKEADRNSRFQRFKRYYSLASPAYYAEISRRLPELIRRTGLNYIKHDFNEMCDTTEGNGSLPTDRHGHERAVEATLRLLALERSANPGIYQNITNWVWFSPWWLEHGNNLWMLAGDHGVNRNLPCISQRKMAITYRDFYIHRVWCDPATRPLVPISHLMTHGIIFANRCTVEKLPTADYAGDTPDDFADYVMMYYGRGLQLKEWYLTLAMMTPERWEILAKATRWSEANVDTLARSVYVGGRPDIGETYGYMSWSKDASHGILVVRNPSPEEQTIEVPFDSTVGYQGDDENTYRSDIVYPHQTPLYGQTFRPGRSIRLNLPGFTTMSLHLTLGVGPKYTGPMVKRMPQWSITDSKRSVNGFLTSIRVSPAKCKRNDLLVTLRGGDHVMVLIDGRPLKPYRINSGITKELADDFVKPSGWTPHWTMLAYDLRPLAGETVQLEVRPYDPAASASTGTGSIKDVFPPTVSPVMIEAWLLADEPDFAARFVRSDDMPPFSQDELPVAVGQGYRRVTQQLVKPLQLDEVPTSITASMISDADLQNAKAAKLRIEIFGNDAGQYGPKQLFINGQKVTDLPNVKTPDSWVTWLIDVPADTVHLLGRENTVTITNPRDDKFKFRGCRLAVRRESGTWAVSSPQLTPQTSLTAWPHEEGGTFKDARVSNGIKIVLP